MTSTFSVSVEPPTLRVRFVCPRCRTTSDGTLPTKASYSAADIAAVATLVARVAARPCGCTE